MPEKLVGQPAQNSVSTIAVTAALATPVINGGRGGMQKALLIKQTPTLRSSRY